MKTPGPEFLWRDSSWCGKGFKNYFTEEHDNAGVFRDMLASIYASDFEWTVSNLGVGVQRAGRFFFWEKRCCIVAQKAESFLLPPSVLGEERSRSCSALMPHDIDGSLLLYFSAGTVNLSERGVASS